MRFRIRKALFLTSFRKQHVEATLRTISTYATCVVVNVRNPASLPVFKRHTATLRLPAKNHHKSTQIAAGESTVGCQPGSKSGSVTKRRKTASYQQYCPAYSNITPPNSPQWIRLASHRIASHHVPQVCNVHRRCGSSRAVFVHVYPRGTQSGRG